MKCRRCGRNIPDRANFCRYCGTRTAAPPARHSAPAGRRNRRRTGGGNGFLVLRIILIVLCVGLVGIGIWKIPGNVQAILASWSRSSGSAPSVSHETQRLTVEPTLSAGEMAAVREELSRMEDATAAEDAHSAEMALRNAYHGMAKDWFTSEEKETGEVTAP
ncbi:MAG: zinc ribbon domain-containing protein [Oscillospiraceae bacterium]|nr:zinc ribbon domain-containing protein [Oscillospiraceae bacterium]